jgi:hypothetical protein
MRNLPNTPRQTRRINRNGVILWESATMVAIVTGLKTRSANRKTGPMLQVWILPRWRNPAERGADHAVCGTCPHSSLRDGDCYVERGKAPAGVWRCYRRGGYAKAGPDVVTGRLVRFGAWGDPAMLPARLVADMASMASGWTGYTHAWRRQPAVSLRGVLMASVDTLAEQMEAAAAGWRTFRVAPTGDAHREPTEISCPASAEAGAKTTCDKCRLCAGTSKMAKSIVIQKH